MNGRRIHKALSVFLTALAPVLFLGYGCNGGGGGSGDGVRGALDNEAPTWEAGASFEVVSTGQSSITVSWGEADDNVAVSGFRVTIDPPPSQNGSPFVLNYQNCSATTRKLTWSSLSSGTEYTFTIVALDASGNTSDPLGPVQASPGSQDPDPPEDVGTIAGDGFWNQPDEPHFVQLMIGWTPSPSTDVDHYMLCISTSDSFSSCDVLGPVDVGDTSPVLVPNDPDGPVLSTNLKKQLAIGTPYYVKVTAVDTAGLRSPGAKWTMIVPGDTPSTDAPEAVEFLEADPENESVTLTWSPPSAGPIPFGYYVYHRIPVAAPDDVTPWTFFSTTNSTEVTVTGLTNGTLYEFMVAGADSFSASRNETPGAATADTADDEAATTTGIPTSGAIGSVPSIRGGVFRQDYFDTRQVRVLVTCKPPALLTTAAGTKFHYTLDGSPIDTVSLVSDKTHGVYDFSDAAHVTEIVEGRLYVVTIDFDPSDGMIQNLSQNTLRPDGVSPDHISLKYLVRAPADASPVFVENYLIYPRPNNSFIQFSGMREIRHFSRPVLIESGSTAGDAIVFGGFNSAWVPSDTAERYRSRFEHFEQLLPKMKSATMLNGPRYDFGATVLADGENVLLSGGFSPLGMLSPQDGPGNQSVALWSYELFSADPADEGFENVGGLTMARARRLHTATRLYDGRVLIVGGLNGQQTILGGVVPGGTPAMTVQKPGSSSPSAEDVSFNMTAYPPPLGLDLVGNIVEILDPTGSQVLETGVIVEAGISSWNGSVMDLTVDGLISVVFHGTPFRIVNAATGEPELFKADGTPDGILAPPASLASNLARYGHTATLLQDGTVLIVGGGYNYRGSTITHDELSLVVYRRDKGKGTFEKLSAYANITWPRYFHTATLLRDGKVLIVGGSERGDYAFSTRGFAEGGLDGEDWTNIAKGEDWRKPPLKGVETSPIHYTAELYDPFTKTTKLLGYRPAQEDPDIKKECTLMRPRMFHGAALLPSGRVLICGGFISITEDGSLVYDDTAEIYDPETETFSPTSKMLTSRGALATLRLEVADSPLSGQILIGGGCENQLAELYNDSRGRFEATAHCLSYDRYLGAVTTPLLDGRVLVSGGQAANQLGATGLEVGGIHNTAEIYDTSKVTFKPAKETMRNRRRHHTATLLRDGTVLVAGGEYILFGDKGLKTWIALSDCEIYDPAAESFTPVPSMNQARYKHTATLLADGRVFICGGSYDFEALQSCEIFDPLTDTFTVAPHMQVGRFDHTATLLANGWVLIAGGEGIDDDSIEIFDPNLDGVGGFIDATVVDRMVSRRIGHAAAQPVYAVGRAQFTAGSATVLGSTAGDAYGHADTAWQTSGAVRPGDVILSEHHNVPYVIKSVDDDHTLTLQDPYAGTSTGEILSEGVTAVAPPNQGFEYYVILSQDVCIAGGEHAYEATEVFRFNPSGTWPTALDGDGEPLDPSDYLFTAGQPFDPVDPDLSGRYGLNLVPLVDLGLLAVGGRFTDKGYGEYTGLAGTPTDFTDDPWSQASLDSDIVEFPRAFRVPNGMIIVVNQHSAQAFLHD